MFDYPVVACTLFTQVKDGVTYCDHLLEQLAPVNQWGVSHVVGPVPGVSSDVGYTIRVTAAHDNTEVTPTPASVVSIVASRGCGCTGMPLSTDIMFSDCTESCVISRGGFVEFSVTDASVASVIDCSQPCQVIQYTNNPASRPDSNTGPDPAMLVIPPVDHYSNSMSFGTVSNIGQSTLQNMGHYVTIVCPTSETSTVRLDGAAIPSGSTWQSIGSFSYVALAVSHGFHTVHSTDAAVNLMAFAFGQATVGAAVGYGFPLAYSSKAHYLRVTVTLTFLNQNVFKPIIASTIGRDILSQLYMPFDTLSE